MFSIVLSRKAAKSLSALEAKPRSKLTEAIEDLADYPFSLKRHDIKKIQGKDHTFRMRTGNQRAIFFVDKGSERIISLKIDFREAVYERL
ncbi:MAG: type II toxin-antitoxin system RelE/ParE family toxin [Thaumarchaeota archaeon]|nr:type II toxin-antitoxin system RelE/ParE family toxin [Nitrososphaerota archaeon]